MNKTAITIGIEKLNSSMTPTPSDHERAQQAAKDFNVQQATSAKDAELHQLDSSNALLRLQLQGLNEAVTAKDARIGEQDATIHSLRFEIDERRRIGALMDAERAADLARIEALSREKETLKANFEDQQKARIADRDSLRAQLAEAVAKLTK